MARSKIVAQVTPLVPLLENGRTIRAIDSKFGLEKEGLILPELGLLLAVDEKECHYPMRVSFANQPLDVDLRALVIDRRGPNRTFL